MSDASPVALPPPTRSWPPGWRRSAGRLAGCLSWLRLRLSRSRRDATLRPRSGGCLVCCLPLRSDVYRNHIALQRRGAPFSPYGTASPAAGGGSGECRLLCRPQCSPSMIASRAVLCGFFVRANWEGPILKAAIFDPTNQAKDGDPLRA